MHASPADSGWQRGESMNSIGRGFDRSSSSIYPLLARTGGIRPPDRVRSRLALTLIDREEISRGPRAKMSLRSIARFLKRSAARSGGMAALPSTAQPSLRRQRGSEPKDPSGASWQAMPISVEQYQPS